MSDVSTRNAAYRATKKKQYEERKEAGLCVGCGNGPPTRGLRCDLCAERIRTSSAQRRATNRAVVRAQQNRSKMKCYRQWKDAGLCTGCGKCPPTSGLKCTRCCERQNSLTAQSRDRKRAVGCYHCGQPRAESSKSCGACLKHKRERDQRAKREVMDAYGGVCECCGEDDLRFLTIDHINNDGNIDRRNNRGSISGRKIYNRLRRLRFPNEFRPLCWNCNNGRAINGGVCPHHDPQCKVTVISSLD